MDLRDNGCAAGFSGHPPVGESLIGPVIGRRQFEPTAVWPVGFPFSHAAFRLDSRFSLSLHLVWVFHMLTVGAELAFLRHGFESTEPLA